MKRGFWRTIWYVLTLTCDESSRILSDAMDRDLSRVERVALRTHNLTCKSCKRFTDQLEFLRKSAQKAVIEDKYSSLTTDAKERMRETLKQAVQEDD